MFSKFTTKILPLLALLPTTAFSGNMMPVFASPKSQPPITPLKENKSDNGFVIILKNGTRFKVEPGKLYMVTKKEILPSAQVKTEKVFMSGEDIIRDTLNNTLEPLNDISLADKENYPQEESTRFYDLTLSNGKKFPIQNDRTYRVILQEQGQQVTKIISGADLIKDTLDGVLEPPVDIYFAE